MAEAASKLQVKSEAKQAERPPAVAEWHPFETVHREIDRLFDEFGRGFSPVLRFALRD